MDKKRLKRHMAVKRAFDVLLSGTAIVLLLPVWIGAAAAIKMDSKGPVIFKQNRMTKNGRIFTMYKFRTMIVGAEKQGTGLFNYRGDKRVTKVGRFLRDTSIDELPQLFNVIKGDLSLVGPRPPVAGSLGPYDTMNKKFKKRFRMFGGITGLAQVKGRNAMTWDEKVWWDNKYIDAFRKYGVWTDIRILAETVVSVLGRSDIYEEQVESADNEIESAEIAAAEAVRMAQQPD